MSTRLGEYGDVIVTQVGTGDGQVGVEVHAGADFIRLQRGEAHWVHGVLSRWLAESRWLDESEEDKDDG